MRIDFTLNGQPQTVHSDPRETLLSVVRDKLGLRGSKYGCGEGECGACSILLNGRPVTSCLVLIGQVVGQDVKTIEAMQSDSIGAHVVNAFAKSGAVQCGFCTPGFVMSTQYLLNHNPTPSREEVREAVAGNLCRCTGYSKIVDAGIAASETMSKSEEPVKVRSGESARCADDSFVRPDTLGEVLTLLSRNDEIKVLGGSTDISVKHEHHLKEYRFVDLTAVSELSFIREEKGSIVIGAATPYIDIIRAKSIQRWASILVDASSEVGAVQIQVLGTLGGNLANASPSADGVPALVALGASAVIRSETSERTVPVEQIATNPGQTIIKRDELITEVVIPKRKTGDGREVGFFEKLGPRQTQTIAIASVSFCGSMTNDCLSDVRIALGAVAPTIIRAPRAEAQLMSGPLTEELVLTAAKTIEQECSPIDDFRASAGYRRKLIGGLLIRGLWPYLNSK